MEFTSLLSSFSSIFPWHPSRIKTLIHIILGMIASANIQQNKLLLGFGSKPKPASICQRIRRFLKEQDFDVKAVAAFLMTLIGINGPVRLVLDRTTWQFGKLDINLLVLAIIVTDRFALPVLVKALPKRGNSNSQERIDLFALLLNLFPPSHIACVIADREFIGKAWIDFLITHNIAFFIRIKANRLVDYGGKMIAIGTFFHHLRKGEKRFLEKNLDGAYFGESEHRFRGS